MESKIIKQLNFYYYGILFLTIISATLSYLFLMKNFVSAVDPMSQAGQIIQYIIIFDVLISVPCGLWLHKRNCKRLAKVEDETIQLTDYKKSATERILLVGHGMVIAIFAFYLMGAYMSMLWVAAISAIGWYFTKPTEKKLYFELHPQDEQY